MKKQNRQGFTLVELMITLVVLAIVAAMTIPGLSGYIHYSQFRRNNGYARTLYYAAEASLTDMRTSGRWDDLSLEIQRYGTPNPDIQGGDRIYSICLDQNEYGGPLSGDARLVAQILENSTYDRELMNAAIALEIDVSTGKVYAAFYGSHCDGLAYAASDGVLNMNDRDYDQRRSLRLGYYGAEEVSADVGLEMSRLKISSIHLLNSEALTLNWSTNSRHDNKDIRFEIKLYSNDGGKELISMELNCSTTSIENGLVAMDVVRNGNKDTYTFPLTYTGGRFTLTLDAMMTAGLMESLTTTALERAGSTSITRFGGDLARPLDIYATVQAFPTYLNMEDDTREYQQSTPTKSNVANSMFADSTAGGNYHISTFRHLSNIRYVNGTGNFVITKQVMDWDLAKAPVYNGTATALSSENTVFPAVPQLKSQQTLSGRSANTTLRNLRLNGASIPSDGAFLGLVCENLGTIRDLKLDKLDLRYTGTTVRGAGGFCGSCSGNGTLTGLSVTGSSVVDVYFKDLAGAADATGVYGAGAVAGILDRVSVEDLSAAGTVTVRLPNAVYNNVYRGGAGGIIGYADLTGAASIEDCSNQASVTGNLCVGGIVGCSWSGDLPQSVNAEVDLNGCDNFGLVLYEDKDTAQVDKGLEGRYVGGIAGYAEKIYISDCTSRSGRATGFAYTLADQDMLQGTYVGGILGFGKNSLLYNCATESGGYVLGHTYVGGIVGGLDGGSYKEVLQSASVTRNASYVIGYSYVGGICGQNKGSSTIHDCVNNGVAVGYETYVGGICGSNEGENAQILNCASYISDTDNRIYEMILEWEATADYSGGLVGYNSGSIIFDEATAKDIINHAVSSIVVGENYVGGVVGFNDVGAVIQADYALISGKINASGDCAGGLVGLNASAQLLAPEELLVMKPIEVRGRYFVGGAIGANLIHLDDKDLEISLLQVDSSLGTVTGEAFCGGLMGYIGTYETLNGDNMLSAGPAAYLPSLISGTNVPVLPNAQNTEYEIIITGNSTSKVLNNMGVRAYAYFGGILGYAHGDSRVVLKDCANAGDLSLSREELSQGSTLNQRVDLEAYLTDQGYTVELNGLRVQLAGGVVGVNGKCHVIDNCQNTGSMNGIGAMGGIVGLNQGYVVNCELDSSMGSSNQDHIGGIVGMNVGTGTQMTYQNEKYLQGTVFNCKNSSGRTIVGQTNVGGIVGYNLTGGVVEGCFSRSNVTGLEAVGGLCGKNEGSVRMTSSETAVSRTVYASSNAAGGVIGINAGTLELQGSSDVVAADAGLTVRSLKYAGGVVGINRGTIRGLVTGTKDYYLVSQAKLVHAIQGYSGGIVGVQENSAVLSYARNESTLVSADAGAAGGIVSVNNGDNTVTQCVNAGDVISNDGFAGGIASQNHGTITHCEVRQGTITAEGVDHIGAVCGTNSGTISDITLDAGSVTLKGSAGNLGAVTGQNEGTVKDCTVSGQPRYDVSGAELTVGGAVGKNISGAVVENVTVENAAFSGFSSYRYLGGVVGWNLGTVKGGSKFSKGTINESGSAVGNCYGGITGLNQGSLENCTVSGITITARGVYTATSTSTAEQKEQLSTHIGGIAGKNDTDATITGCTIDSDQTSAITVENGMVGGVVGFNKGKITKSGDSDTVSAMGSAGSISALLSQTKGFKQNDYYVKWDGSADVEDLTYSSGGKTVSSGCSMRIIVSTNGNLGGITGYNSPTGQMDHCGSGDWFLNNKSEGLGLGTGGIIGMNEGEKELSFLVNRAFVGRQLKSGVTNRFAGGIIGNQNNSTSSGWTIRQCVNYGTVYCYNTHYSGGVIGQWSGNGGTLRECYNYGNLQTTYSTDWVGASGGIVAQIFRPTTNDRYNILSCQNHGNIYGRGGASNGNSANDSAGILGNITGYRIDSGTGPTVYFNVVDCVNGPGVKIYSNSMASGVVGFISIDRSPGAAPIATSTQNFVLNISRCRSYAGTLSGASFQAGIFGDRRGGDTAGNNTYITDCFATYNGNEFPIVSLAGTNSANLNSSNTGYNYYFNSLSGTDTIRRGSANLSGNVTKENSYKEYSMGGTRMVYRLVVSNPENGNQYVYILNGEDSQRGGNCFSNGTSFSVVRYSKFTSSNSYIGNDGIITSNGNTTTGRALFYTTKSYSLDDIKTAGSDFDDYVRTAYRTRERVTGKTVIDAPNKEDVKASEINGIYTVTITDDSKPFYYEVKFSVGEADTVYYLFPMGMPGSDGTYTSSDSFYVGSSGATVSVRAVSMYADASPSGWVEANDAEAKTSLPKPQLEGWLVKTTKGYQYKFRLANEADYPDTGWSVIATTLDGQALTFPVTNNSDTLDASQNIQELMAYAKSARADYKDSENVHISINIPAGGLPGNAAKPAALEGTISGNTQDSLVVTARLTWAAGQMDTPPIYRVELLGTLDGQEVVLAHTDVLAAAGSTVNAIFRDLPDVITEAKDLQLRAWYADTGLGGILTYEILSDDTGANVTIRNQDGTYTYLSSVVLDNTTYFDGFVKETGLNLTFLDPPVLMDPGAGVYLTPNWTEDKKELRYTFSWDADLPGTADTRYSVNLMGIDVDADGNRKEVLILTDQVYTDPTAREFTINADDWQYSEVRLTVTRLGDADAGQIGRSSSREYLVSRRLDAPGQPFVANDNPNELDYTVTWVYADKVNCGGYTLYVSHAGGVEAYPIAGSDSAEKVISLDAYAGTTVDIYLRANAATAGYADSTDGPAYTLEVPKRLDKPTGVTWSTNWTYQQDAALSVSDFTSGGMRVQVDTNGYQLPGGSAFLLKAEILDTDLQTVLKYYDAQAMLTSNDTLHYHDLQGISLKYAGRYIRFSLRTTYGDGMVSSDWAQSQVFQLPYVKLAAPTAVSDETTRDMTVFLGNTPDLKGQEERQWTATLRTLTWSSVECADAYLVTITQKDGTQLKLRISQTDGGIQVEKLGSDGTWSQLDSQNGQIELGTTSELTGLYSTSTTLPYFTYTMDTVLSWTAGDDGNYTFTLLLPNISTAQTDLMEMLDVGETQAPAVTVQADVQENQTGAGSPSYVASEEQTHSYTN